VTINDIALAKDGGWGWVVVFAAFMCNLILDGTVFSFGLMQEHIVNCTSTVESEREAMSTVAWVGSLLFGFNLLSGIYWTGFHWNAMNISRNTLIVYLMPSRPLCVSSGQ
jgi:hypothetical protein